MTDVVELEPETQTELPLIFSEDEIIAQVRMVEALLFASADAVSAEALKERLPEGADIPELLVRLKMHYAERGVNLVCVAGKWQFRTAEDLRFLLERERHEIKRLSRAALETMAIIAYHQPVTRAEIEEVRGVSISKGTLDQLMEMGWVRLKGRRRTPGRPVTYGTTDAFLVHFGLDTTKDLPGMEELRATGLLENVPSGAIADKLRIGRGREPEDPIDGDEPMQEAAPDEAPPGEEPEEEKMGEVVIGAFGSDAEGRGPDSET